MKWNELTEMEINWLKERSQTAPDPLLKKWFEALVDMGQRVKSIQIGSAHNEEGGCTCGHCNTEASDRSFFYHAISDFVDLCEVGYLTGNPDDGAVHSTNLHELRRIGIKTELGCVVSSRERAEAIIRSSNHPLKKKIRPMPMVWGHLMNRITMDGGFLLDGPTVHRLYALLQYSVTSRRDHGPDDDDSRKRREDDLALAKEYGESGKLLLHHITAPFGIVASFDISLGTKGNPS